MGTLQDANTAAVLAAGQNPTWSKELTSGASLPFAIPEDASDGVSVYGSLRAMAHLALREVPSRRKATIYITFDAATTYTATIDGTACNGSGVSRDAACVALALAINTAALGVTATAVDANGVASTGSSIKVEVIGDTDTDYSFDVSVAGGAGAALGVVDAVSALVTLYAWPGGIGAPAAWVAVNNFVSVAATNKGLTERFDSAGIDRLYLYPVLSGHASDGSGVIQSAAVYIGSVA